MTNYYVYVHRVADRGVFYVGKGCNRMGNGVANFAADKKMYVFRNVKTGETRTCHRADMAWVGPNFKSLFKTEKPLKTYFGWEVLSCHG